MGDILVGITSWTEPTLVKSGRFYPEEMTSAEERLKYYAGQFSITEVDSTYYGLPAERNASLWAERTGKNFVFDVKAFRLFTQHPTPRTGLPKDLREALPRELADKKNLYYRHLPDEIVDELWSRFEKALFPLARAGKLGVVLFQFPHWFVPRKDRKEYLVHCRERFADYRIAVEFRRGSWVGEDRAERTFDFLRDHDIAYVSVDEPQGFDSSVPPVAEATSDVAVVRLHGRNKKNWKKKGISTADRFDYLYSKKELRSWVPKVRELASKADRVHVLFNNCHADKSVVSARRMEELLGQG